MSEVNKASIDLDAIRRDLEAKAETPAPGRDTKKDQVANLYDAIQAMRRNRYTLAMIAETLTEKGIVIAPHTLRQYLYQIDQERGGDGKGNANAKLSKRSRKASVNDKVSPQNNSAATPPTKEGNRAGNVLSSKPEMGGAFNPDKL